ncbi:hypothetical protein GH741_02880 [Aquibacillus halophilus]|uniref:DUF2187 domain-containing protein n=1 Tax=Aquibacillus halophilus TaxID=930132 RepID=A0A6A8D783_9BACI|nr:hypothetical protein [Aquibacillus halophilus]MRH41615.1 hypothetical protein [Aquibacillus halophilus]
MDMKKEGVTHNVEAGDKIHFEGNNGKVIKLLENSIIVEYFNNETEDIDRTVLTKEEYTKK